MSASPEPPSTGAPSRDGSTVEVLRFTTAGSVDDGKSTLIGRLLFDSKAVYEDHLTSIAKSGTNRSNGLVDLSLLTDGLRAEREQGITIDVAYRYFATPKRKFIIADTPGHEQYTRNMATGASTAQAAVVLVDASKGLLPQSKRHACIAALLGIRHAVVAVNKMDLVGYREDVFLSIREQFADFARRLGMFQVYALPISALRGDNIVAASTEMPWFKGPPLLEHLETLPLMSSESSAPLRLPIQYVIRTSSGFRGFAGQVASGVLSKGAAVVALPSRIHTRVASIVTYDGELETAAPGRSVCVTLEEEIDLGRGDVLVDPAGPPKTAGCLAAKLIWFGQEASQPGKHYLLKHTTRIVKARLGAILHRIDVNTLDHLPPAALRMNDIAQVRVDTSLPLFFDAYRANRTMGSFILIDPDTNATVAAGMIDDAIDARAAADTDAKGAVALREWMERNRCPPCAFWIAGRPELVDRFERAAFEAGFQIVLVDTAAYDAAGLRLIATLLSKVAVVAVFAAPEGGPGPGPAAVPARDYIVSIYGEEFVYSAADPPASERAAITLMLQWLADARRRCGIQDHPDLI